MTITAKYAGTCPSCRKPIAPGQKVEWAKGSQARHVSCAAGGVAPIAPVSMARPASRPAYVRRPGFGPGHGSAARVAGYSSYCTDNANCRCYDCAS
jgi:hypothetical protein